MSVEWVRARVEYPVRVTSVYFNSVSLECRVRILELLTFLGVVWWDSPNLTNTGVLTAGAAFVPENVFWGGSKDKPHILQHPLWAEDTQCRQWGWAGRPISVLLGKARDKHSQSLKELF